MNINSEMKEFLASVVGCVEATSYEIMCLWNEYHKQRQLSWVPARSGRMPTIGVLDKRPVVLSLLINVVNGHPILFFEATSAVVDHTMVQEWLKLHLPESALKSNGEYVKSVDAMNFHNVLPH